MANDLTSSINNRVGGQQTASRADMVNRTARNYAQNAQSATITTTSGKQYTVDRSQMDWIKSRYMADQAGTYGYDDADQQAKANGQMSAKWRSTYGNSNVDRQLAELGLPSEKNLEKYIAQYDQWHTGGMDQVFKQANLPNDFWTKAKGWYQSDLKNAYENTAEDQQRKAYGLMPAKYEAKYTDTEIDDELLARGLPPVSEYYTYVNRYNNYAGIENFYVNVARNETNLRLAGINEDDKMYLWDDGNEYTGKDLYAKAFSDELNRVDNGKLVYSDIMPLFKDSASEDDDYANYNAFSYDDYKSHYDDLYNRYFANQKTGDGQLVSDAIAVQQRRADAEATKEYFAGAKKDPAAFAEQYTKDHPSVNPEEMFLDMFRNGVTYEVVQKAMKAMRTDASRTGGKNRADDGTSGFYDITDAFARAWTLYREESSKPDESYKQVEGANFTPSDVVGKIKTEHGNKPHGEWSEDEAMGLMKELDEMGVSRDVIMSAIEDEADLAQLAEYVDKYFKGAPLAERYNDLLDDMHASTDAARKAAAEDTATVDKTATSIQSAIANMIDESVAGADVDAVLSVIDAVSRANYTNAIAVDLALEDLGFSPYGDFSGWAADVTANWSKGDLAKLKATLGDFRVIKDESEYKGLGLDEMFGLKDWRLRDTNIVLRDNDFSLALDWARQKVADGELTDWEAYQILAADGFQNEMEYYMPEEWHKAHFIENVAPGLINQSREEDRLLWEEMTSEQRRDMATEMWNDLTDEQKSSMYGENWWKFDGNVYRTFGQALEQQFSAVLPGLAAEIVGTPLKVFDAIDAGITGRPEMLDATQKVMAVQQKIGQYGAVNDPINGTKVADVAADVVQELGRMYFYGSIGGAIGAGFAGTSAGSAVMAGAASDSAVVRGASKMFMSMVKSSPFVVSAFSNNYSEAKELGASNSEATWFGLLTGLTEGILEGFEFDELWGRALGQGNFAKQLALGKATYLERLGIVGKAWISSAAVSGLGEFTEESIGYVLETFLKMRHSDTWGKGTEWSASDWLQQAMMGFITGALGGGLSAGGSFVKDGVALSKAIRDNPSLQAALPDILAIDGEAKTMPKSTLDAYRKGGATVLSRSAYDQLVTQIENNNKGIENYTNTINAIETSRQKAIGDAKLEVDKLAAKLAPYTTPDASGNIPVFPAEVYDRELAPLITKYQAALKHLDYVTNNMDPKTEEKLKEAKSNLENNLTQKETLAKKEQEHWAGLFLMNEHLHDILSEEMIDNLSRAYQNGATVEPESVRDSSSQTVDANQATGYNNNAVQEVATNGRGNEAAPGGNARVSEQAVAGSNQGVQGSGADGRRNSVLARNDVASWATSNGISVVDMAETPAQQFYNAIGEAKASNPYGAFVTQHELDEYKGMKTFTNADGSVGVAVKDDGDIVSVFKNTAKSKDKGAVTSILFKALENGGKKLDNFNSPGLSAFYLQHGFVPVARIAFNDEYAPDDWNYERDGRPNILFWVHNGDSVDTIMEKMGTYQMPNVENLPFFDGENAYDEAKAYRDSLVDENTGWAAKQTAETAQAPGTRRLTNDEVAKVQQAVKDIKYKGEVTFVDDPNVEDAWIDDNGNITINRANISEAEAKELSDNPAWWLLKHEFTHFIEGTAEYDAYSSVVQDILRRRFGDNYGKVLDAVKQDYAQRGRNLDDTGVLRELVAKFSQSDEILNNEETINAFVREQGNIADRIYNWIRYKINDLKLRRNPNSALARELLRAERLYAQAYRSANRKAPSSNETRLSTGRSLSDLTREYAGVANPRTGVTAEEDAAYMKAALAGDTETAGRMVRDMYERNGLMRVYRGEPKATGSWTQVDMDKFNGPGMFAATDIDTARASEYTQSYAREDLKTKPLSYGDEMPVLQQFADGVAQRIGRGMNLLAESYYMDDEGNTYAEDGKGREHHWALRDADTGDIFADSTELTTLADAAKRKAARLIGGNAENIYNSINDPFAGRILDLFVKFDNANEHNARGDEWDKIQLNAPKGVTLYRIEVTNDPNDENVATITAYPIDESFDAESSSTSERNTKSITFTAEDDLDYSYKLDKAFKDLFGAKSDVGEFFMDYADWNEDGATLEKVGVRDKNGKYVSPELFPEAETISTDELAARDKAAGYDGSIIRNVRDGGSRPTTDTVSFNPNFIKSADAITYDDNGNIIPLSQRGDFSRNELRYSTGRSLNELLQQYGAIEQGRNPRARDTQVPKRTNDNNRVSQWIRSLVESDKLTDDQAQNVLRMVVEQDYGTYVPTSQAERMQEAREYIAGRQPLQAQQEFHDMVMQGKFGVKTNALGIQLLSDASARGDIESVLDIASDLQLAATEAGQSAQIFNVLKELKGVGSAWYMQKVIDRMNSKYADRIAAGKMQKIAVDPALMADLAKATTVDQIAAAEEAVAKDVARQLPLTWDDRLSSWRYFSMLANPTTHIRNITGNLLMKGLNAAKDVVATGIEKGLGIDQNQRAHAVLTSADRSTWGNFAQQSYEEQAKNLSGGGKLGFETFIKQNMRSFDTKWVNALAKFNFNALEGEDIAFIRPAYKTALMQYMKAQGYTLNSEGKAGKVGKDGSFTEMSKAEMNAAIDWASNQAWKATFRDASSLATMLNKLSKENAVSRLLVEGVMPFKKTPINIAKRGLEYSPAGIIMGTTQLLTKVKQGKMSAASAIDNLASGITGTALMALGVFLAKAGVIRAGGEDKKKYETYLEDTGDQTYAFKFGDASINMSSIAPATIPLFMGVALQEMIGRSGDSVDLSTITDVLAGTLNPFMEMSFMSSLNSALKNYNNDGIGGALGSTIMTAAQNYGSQYLPTLGGKVAQFVDPTVRSTKSDATSPVGGNLDYYARSLAKKVPGLEATLQPDVDVWGRTNTKDSFGDWALDFANKFILPTNIKVSNRDAVDKELIRVVESTGNTDFLPSDGNKYFTVKGQKYTMNAKQYAQYSQERGQAAYAAIKDVMASSVYMTASDEDKANMLNKAKEAAYKAVNNIWKDKLGAFNN